MVAHTRPQFYVHQQLNGLIRRVLKRTDIHEGTVWFDKGDVKHLGGSTSHFDTVIWMSNFRCRNSRHIIR